LPKGVPKTEEERTEEHKEKYGEEAEPPVERKGLGAYAGTNWTAVALAFLAGLVIGLLF